MSAREQILMAEEKVAGLQSQLSTVGAVLETAEQIVVEGEKAGRLLRRIFRYLLIASIIAAVVLAVRKMMGGRCLAGRSMTDEPDPAPEATEPVEDDEAGDEAADVS